MENEKGKMEYGIWKSGGVRDEARTVVRLYLDHAGS